MKTISSKKLNLYIIVGIIFVLVFGATYAYFVTSLNVEGNINQMVTETGTLELNYVDGDFITGENVYPGWSANKTIVVTNIGSLDAYYKIYWKELTNNFEQEELVLKAVCTSYEHYGEENQVISGSCNDIEETPIANVAGSIKENIGVEEGFTHVYYFTFTFKEMSSLQNYNQGKTFGGVLNIDDSYGLYTMNGTLLDEEGNPLASTLVTLSNGKSATTNAEGRFTIEEVDEGNYNLTIGEVTDSLTLETGRELGSSGNTITSNIENKEINVTIQLGNDSITYNVTEPIDYDVNMVALYVDGQKVSSLDPNSHYILESYACTNGETVEWNDETKTTSITPNISATRCTLNYNLSTLIRKMNLSSAQSDSLIVFSMTSDGLGYNSNNEKTTIATPNSNGRGLYYTSDLTKTEGGQRVYYYRGVVENNYVVFAGFCWRIVRTNEDGSIKLRYGGDPTGNSGSYICPTTGVDIGINNKAEVRFNQTYGDNTYVGYMMGLENQCANTTYCAGTVHSTAETAQANVYDSNIKSVIDSWYENNIANQGTNVTSKIANTIYCNDRSIYDGTGVGISPTAYNVSTRLANGSANISINANPQYKCANASSDGFTLSVENGGRQGYGNNALTYPVGLLTADEVVYAGGSYLSTNSTYYLRTGYKYWVSGAYGFDGSYVYGFFVNTPGDFNGGRFFGLQRAVPAISLKPEVIVSNGTGNYNSPYEID